jgi:hypothetical protein
MQILQELDPRTFAQLEIVRAGIKQLKINSSLNGTI